MQNEFINIAAHELRTPIQPILGLSSIIGTKGMDPKKQQEIIDIVVRNAKRLQKLSENILDVTRIESGTLELRKEHVRLNELISDATVDFQSQIRWIDLCSDYECVRHAWILEAMREIRTARKIGINLINVHANLNGMFYGEKRHGLLDNMIKSLREIISYAERSNIKVMLENVPLSNGIHSVNEFKYIIDNVDSLLVHLDIPHAFTSGGMKSVLYYISR